MSALSFVFLGLSITSSWGNGHATTYRGLLRELSRRGHSVTFLERDVPNHAENRDLPSPPFGTTALYDSVDDLRDRFTRTVREADVVVVGSRVTEGVTVGDWALENTRGTAAFYDLDTPVTLRMLDAGGAPYLLPRQVPSYDIYLSFTGGPTLGVLERRFGSPRARPLYCSADTELYCPAAEATRWDLGYLGAYCEDRQAGVSRLMTDPARRIPQGRFVVAGAQYPTAMGWPPNVERRTHLLPAERAAFYNAQRFALNVTRRDMVRAGHSPSVRLFESAACGTPVISDHWPGIEAFFTPGEEILLARAGDDVVRILQTTRDVDRVAIGARARRRILAEHTSAHRAEVLEEYIRDQKPKSRPRPQTIPTPDESQGSP